VSINLKVEKNLSLYKHVSMYQGLGIKKDEKRKKKGKRREKQKKQPKRKWRWMKRSSNVIIIFYTKTVLVEILLLWCQLNRYEIAQENKALFSILSH